MNIKIDIMYYFCFADASLGSLGSKTISQFPKVISHLQQNRGFIFYSMQRSKIFFLEVVVMWYFSKPIQVFLPVLHILQMLYKR